MQFNEASLSELQCFCISGEQQSGKASHFNSDRNIITAYHTLAHADKFLLLLLLPPILWAFLHAVQRSKPV
jgi:hypothetical protein